MAEMAVILRADPIKIPFDNNNNNTTIPLLKGHTLIQTFAQYINC